LNVSANDEVEVRFINLGNVGGYQFALEVPGIDCSDLPADGSTAPDGTASATTYGNAPHLIRSSSIRLGSNVDGETVSISSADATGDDTDDDGISSFPTLTAGDSDYSIPAGNITAPGTGLLHAWIDFDGDGSLESTEHTSVSVNAGTPTGSLDWTGQNTHTGNTTFARFRFTSDPNIDENTPTGLASDGEVEDYVVAIATPSNADLLVVERITAINRGQANEQRFDTTFEDVITGVASAADNYVNWPTPIDATSGISDYLAGAIGRGLNVGDEVEYTVYFIASGDKPITNVRICDMVPPNTTYVAGSMELSYNGTTTTLSDTGADGDGGEFVSAPTVPTTPCPEPTNDQGAVVVSIAESPTTIPNATAPGTPTDAYGYIRFRVTVD
ncbi:MAG: GEVED domain-containing protein, partial [Cyanobacteria bacterium J06598_3]